MLGFDPLPASNLPAAAEMSPSLALPVVLLPLSEAEELATSSPGWEAVPPGTVPAICTATFEGGPALLAGPRLTPTVSAGPTVGPEGETCVASSRRAGLKATG